MYPPGLGPILDAGAVAELSTGHGDTVLCDVRWYLDGRSGLEAYEAGHLPGAVFVDLDEHLTAEPGPGVGRHPLPVAEAFAGSMGELGIGPDDTVVAYDDAGGMSAGRLVWMLRVLGQAAALLDGGIGAWSGQLETRTPQRTPVDVPVRPWPDRAFVDIGDVAAGAAGRVLLDARAPERYRGEVEPMDPRAGHVPGAVNAPFAANLVDGRFLLPADLSDHYRALGVEDATDVVAYCGSGVSACHDLLAMEHAGMGRGRLYVGSWSQWSASNHPIATG
jgi:thiosulfate/3-mercaptopyruvate sulfurtransferase|tara:strand:- start:130 stop:960 length:831 start_codon:yes stop_codon:yes gene_type:complete